MYAIHTSRKPHRINVVGEMLFKVNIYTALTKQKYHYSFLDETLGVFLQVWYKSNYLL